jgi:hypothetical protein
MRPAGGWKTSPFRRLELEAMYTHIGICCPSEDRMPRRDEPIYIYINCGEGSHGRSALPKLSSPYLRNFSKAINIYDAEDDDLVYLTRATNICFLSVESDKVTDKGVASVLRNCPDLEYLRLVGSGLTVQAVGRFGQLKRLRALEFRPGTLQGMSADWNDEAMRQKFEFLIIKEQNDAEPACSWDLDYCPG